MSVAVAGTAAPHVGQAEQASTSQMPLSAAPPRPHIHVVLLYHPGAQIWAAHQPAAVVQRIVGLFSSSNAAVYVAQIRYGYGNRTEEKGDGEDASKRNGSLSTPLLLSASSGLVISHLAPSEEYLKEHQKRQTVSAPPGMESDAVLRNVSNNVHLARSSSSWEDDVDAVMSPARPKELDAQASAKTSVAAGRLVDGLTAALELFAAHSSLRDPLARYVVHVLPSSASLDLRDSTSPGFNLDSNHDRLGWRQMAEELGRMSVWPVTIALPPSPLAVASLSPDSEEVHEAIAVQLPSTLPSLANSPSILGVAFRPLHYSRSMLLSGLSDAAATAAHAALTATKTFTGRKRPRKDSHAHTGVMQSGTPAPGSSVTDDGGGSLASISTKGDGAATQAAERPQRPTEMEQKQAFQKVLFLQQQQQMMMRSLKVLKERQEKEATSSSSVATQSQMLDRLREQLHAHHESLRSQVSIFTSAGKLPDLGASLSALIEIDKEASEKGLNLGGPSNIQALMIRHRQQQQHQQQQQQPASQEQAMQQRVAARNNAPDTSTATSSTVAGQSADPAPKQPLNSQPFWLGAIMWSVALPNKQRSQVATLVSAQCAPNTAKENLMLPWPQKFMVSEVQTVTLSALQQYAASKRIPCILFQPHVLAQQPGQTQRPQQQQTNESMYLMLARMIDTKKGCAFMKLQGPNIAPDSGIVVIPTTPPGGGSARRLLGLVFNKAVPWHLFAPQPVPASTSTQAASQPQTQQKPSAGPAATSVSGGAQPDGLTQPPQSLPTMIAPTTMQSGADASSGGSMSTAQLNQQLPTWARPQASTVNASAAFGGIDTGVSGTAMPLQAPQNTAPAMPGNIDLAALATQLGLAGRQLPLQQQPQQQVGQASWSATAGNDAAASNTAGAAIDFEALQRMLGLNSS